jgi:transglutaminase-like putative cysteine protease
VRFRTTFVKTLSPALWLAVIGPWIAPQAAAPSDAPPLSDVVRAPRPKGGEYFGLYLLDKKVGYAFNDLTSVPGRKDQVRAVSNFVFRATVGNKVAERIHNETRIYESKPGGRLLSFVVEDQGDGGNQTFKGTALPDGIRVVQSRPGQPDQIRKLPPTTEMVEDADQARVAVLRSKDVTGTILDGQDLQNYRADTTLGPVERRLVRGVKIRLHKVVTLVQKEKIPIEGFLTDAGEMVEFSLGPNLKAISESESVAKRLDVVEVFALTRVVLPKPLPPTVRRVPATISLVVTGLPERFQRNSYRENFQRLSDDKVEVTLSAADPKLARPATRPVEDPSMGEYLKSSIAVESDHPEIRQRAAQIVGTEKNAYRAAQKIVTWVAGNMKKDYGSSADRASDVLHQMKGDCTEHSLLAEALLRAAGIPAKRVDGLVYMVGDDQVPALYWHEWVEAYVGEWTQLDPTFDQVVADAGHFALGEESNAEITPLIGQLKVLEVR